MYRSAWQEARALGTSRSVKGETQHRTGRLRELRARADAPNGRGDTGAAPGVIGAAVGAATAGALAAVVARSGPSLQNEKAYAVDYDTALSNGSPTVVEFYADWCDVCRRSAAKVVEATNNCKAPMNLVMLNVDNPSWAQEAREYGVFGIPHFQFLDANGNSVGAAIGDVPPTILQRQLNELAYGEPVEQLSKPFATNSLPDAPSGGVQASPRAHSQFS